MKGKNNSDGNNNKGAVVHHVQPRPTKHRGYHDGKKREWNNNNNSNNHHSNNRIVNGSKESTTNGTTAIISFTNPNTTKNQQQQQTSQQQEQSLFDKLDPNDTVQYKRMQQRRKQIEMGKNTAGYECYIRQIPKAKRKPRSMDTPSTPDHTVDIPAKRWAGIVRAWRVALHKYDPPDLVSNVPMTIETEKTTTEQTTSQANVILSETPISKREQQLTEAKDQGLLVDFGLTTPPQHNKKQSEMDENYDDDDVGTPITVLTTTSKRSLDDEFGFNHRSLDIDDDSDDDLL